MKRQTYLTGIEEFWFDCHQGGGVLKWGLLATKLVGNEVCYVIKKQIR